MSEEEPMHRHLALLAPQWKVSQQGTLIAFKGKTEKMRSTAEEAVELVVAERDCEPPRPRFALTLGELGNQERWPRAAFTNGRRHG
jgi:hypothetical protein